MISPPFTIPWIILKYCKISCSTLTVISFDPPFCFLNVLEYFLLLLFLRLYVVEYVPPVCLEDSIPFNCNPYVNDAWCEGSNVLYNFVMNSFAKVSLYLDIFGSWPISYLKAKSTILWTLNSSPFLNKTSLAILLDFIN